MEEKTNKKLEVIKKSLRENQEEAVKWIKEITQNLKIEIETIKKTQTEGILKRKIWVNSQEPQM